MIFGIHDPQYVGYQCKAYRMALGKKQAWLSSVLEVNQLGICAFERNKYTSYRMNVPRLIEILDEEKERQIEEHGEWYDFVLTVKFLTNMIDILESIPIKQKEYYEHLLGYLKIADAMGYQPWSYIVNDEAFGKMTLFGVKEEDNGEHTLSVESKSG